MKFLQGLIAVFALLMAFQASATTVSYSHEGSDHVPAKRAHSYISKLFRFLDTGSAMSGRSWAGFSQNSRSSRNGDRFRTRSWHDLMGLFRNSGKMKTLYSSQGNQREIFHRNSLREWYLLQGKGVDGMSGGGISPLMTATASAVPVPAAVWLFGSGLAGLFAFAFRCRA